jgi:hypothetical protein
MPSYSLLTIDTNFATVFQFLAVAGTPKADSTAGANLERPIPFGANR